MKQIVSNLMTPLTSVKHFKLLFQKLYDVAGSAYGLRTNVSNTFAKMVGILEKCICDTNE